MSGHLSFSTLATRNGPHAFNQIAADGRRSIVVHRSRSAQDFPLPGVVVGQVRRSVTQNYVLVARVAPAKTPYLDDDRLTDVQETGGALVGVVAVIPTSDGAQGRSARAALLKKVKRRIAAAGGSQHPTVPGSFPLDLIGELQAAQPATALQFVRIALFRTGEARIWLHNDEFLGRNTTTVPLTAPEQAAAEGVALQAYLFLKDVVHRHYHHRPHTDQLLVPTRIDLTASDHTIEDAHWRIGTLRGLVRVVTEYRQARSPTSNKQALGVIAYADAFQAKLAKILRSPDTGGSVINPSKTTAYDFQHMRSSLEAQDSLAESGRGFLLQLVGILIGVALSAAALWAGMVQIQPMLCETVKLTARPCPKPQANGAVDFVNAVVANPSAFVTLLVVFGFTASVYLFNGLSAVPGAKRVSAELRRSAIAVASSVARTRSDVWGWAAALAFLLALMAATSLLAWFLVPKRNVPERTAPVPERLTGRYASLDKFIGQSVTKSRLLVDSPVATPLRDLLGPDYATFTRLMGDDATLARDGALLWAAGGPSPRAGRDGAYLVIHQIDGRIEVAIFNAEKPVILRSPGDVLTKPSAVLSALGRTGVDAGPMEPPVPFCRTAVGGKDGHVLTYSGILTGAQACHYNVILKAGQRISFKPASIRGLVIDIGSSSVPIKRLKPGYEAKVDEVHTIAVKWSKVGVSRQLAREPREFYARIDIK